MVTRDHDHPNAGLVAGTYCIWNINSRRVLQPDETQERQRLERLAIWHWFLVRRER
jgi:hypothetical protein